MTALVKSNLPFVAAAPNGISTLRELILELAIQGRILNRERSAQSWQMRKLPEVATYRIGKTPPSKEARHWDDAGIPWVSISDMEHFTVLTKTSRSVSKDMAPETFKYPPVPAGSLLMSFKLTVGKICVLGVDGYHNEAIISLQPKEGVLRDYLMRVLPSIARAGKTKDALMGATLNSASLAELIIPLPTLDEQVRVVAKVDELMALCDRLEADQADAEAAHAQLVQALLDSLTQATDAADFRASWQRLSEHFHTLFTTEASIDALKQTVLQLAVMGKLVPQAMNDETASELLMRLRNSRNQWLEVHANENAECRTMQRKLSLISEPNAPFPIPSTWQPVRLIDCCQLLVDCHNKTAPYVPAGIPIIRTSNIRERRFRLDDLRFVSDETYEFWSRRCPPQAGDIMFTREAPMGEAAIIPKGAKYCLGQRTMLIRPMHDFISNEYLLIALTEPHLLERASTEAIGSTVKHLRVGDVENLAIPLPPLAEQHRIVTKVDELMALCDQLKAQLADARQHHAQLATALVEQAVA